MLRKVLSSYPDAYNTFIAKSERKKEKKMEKRITAATFFLFMILFLTVAIETAEGKIEDEIMMPVKQVHLEHAKGIYERVDQRETKAYRDGLAAYISNINEKVSEHEAGNMVDAVMTSAEKYDVDEKLIMAVAHTESTYYSDAVSCADYKGLMQTGDHLAKAAGYQPEDLFQPEVSIDVGAQYIEEQMETFNDDVRLALTAYNQGPGAVYEGGYSTDYAEKTMERIGEIESFLKEEGYLE